MNTIHEPCEACNGSGKIDPNHAVPFGMSNRIQCRHCRGTGFKDSLRGGSYEKSDFEISCMINTIGAYSKKRTNILELIKNAEDYEVPHCRGDAASQMEEELVVLKAILSKIKEELNR